MDTAGLEHQHLRSALDFALVSTAEGQKLRSSLKFPAALKPYLKMQRLPAAALGPVRRAIEADPSFRTRLAEGALPELVDEIGMLWLRRPEGWEQRAVELVRSEAAAEEQASIEAALRKAEKRRQAAEAATVRARAEVGQLRDRVAELEALAADFRAALAAAAAANEATQHELGAARTAARHAADREAAAQRRAAAAEAALADALHRAEAAERRRDDVLADRAGLDGASRTETLVELRAAAERARSLADTLAAIVGSSVPRRRTPIGLPGGVLGDTTEAAEFLLRVPGAQVIVDGYNVAKLGWPDDELEQQRERCLDVVDDVVRRYSTRLAVIFDGADVSGGARRRRRLARVAFSPAGTIADDVIRAEVAATPVEVPVVVVTSDGAVARDVRAMGANTIASRTFLDAALR